jgi:hypothetical protein
MKIGRKENTNDMPGLLFPEGMEKDGGDKKGKDQRSARQENENISVDQIEQPLKDHA